MYFVLGLTLWSHYDILLTCAIFLVKFEHFTTGNASIRDKSANFRYERYLIFN